MKSICGIDCTNYFEESCHFPQWSESDRFNKLTCNLLT